jgi:flagellar biosynthesis/type III secretory pathway protein FliH
MTKRRKETKQQKDERRARDAMKFNEGFNMGFAEGYKIAKKEGAKECDSLSGLQRQETFVSPTQTTNL